jgi:phosphatidate phosphatase APP1
MNKPIGIFILLLLTCSNSFCQVKKYSFTNEYINYGNRTDYFNWKVYITGDNIFLASIKQIEYYLDPSFKNSTRIITPATGGQNFTLCTNGWGEFIIRIKIVFKNASTSINDTYKLDLHSESKKNKNYRCPDIVLVRRLPTVH